MWGQLLLSGVTADGVESKVHRAPWTPRAAAERTRRLKVFAMKATIYMKKQGLMRKIRYFPKTYLADKKPLSCSSRNGQGELKVEAKATML